MKAVEKIQAITKNFKAHFGQVYASYVLSIVMGALIPESFIRLVSHQITLPYTMAFTNVPGILKPISYKGVTTQSMKSFVVPAGASGMALCALSFNGKFILTFNKDTCIDVDSQEIIQQIENAIMSYVELAEKDQDVTSKKLN